jgi:mono/diheme cytochrome c family protein
MKHSFIKLAPVAAIALLLTACGRDPKSTGRIYMPDMTYSNSYKTFVESDVKTPEGNAMSARLPVANTVPYGYIPDDSAVRKNPALMMSYVIKNHYTHDAAKWQEEYDRAGNEIKDPVAYTDENLAEGARLFNIDCTPCHGTAGEGNGQLVELPGGGDGPFASRPPAYKTELPKYKDGNIFYIVSYGKNMMGGYGFQLSVKERWQIIHYIKKLAGITPGAAKEETTKAEPVVKNKKG